MLKVSVKSDLTLLTNVAFQFHWAVSGERGNLFVLTVGPFLQHYLADRLMTVTIQSIQNLFPHAFDSALVPFDPLQEQFIWQVVCGQYIHSFNLSAPLRKMAQCCWKKSEMVTCSVWASAALCPIQNDPFLHHSPWVRRAVGPKHVWVLTVFRSTWWRWFLTHCPQCVTVTVMAGMLNLGNSQWICVKSSLEWLSVALFPAAHRCAALGQSVQSSKATLGLREL